MPSNRRGLAADAPLSQLTCFFGRSVTLCLSVAGVIGVISLLYFNLSVPHSSLLGVQKKASPNPIRKKLADGCHHIFLDVGANIGVHR